MKNEKLKAFFAKVKVFLTHTGKIAIIAGAMVFGFLAGDVYHRLQKNESEKPVVNLKNVHSLLETSVAINERNELMIINRRTGTYEIYQDSIGSVIFSLYAGKIYSSKTDVSITKGQ